MHGRELWKSDGTAAGTVLVKDIDPGGQLGSYPSIPDERQRHAVLLGQRRHARRRAVEERRHRGRHRAGQGRRPGHPSNLTNVNGTLFFAANDGTNGRELWKSDGTAAGTALVKDIYPGTSRYYDYWGGYRDYPNSSYPSNLTNVNGTLFFTANDGTNGRELWKSDGTAAGTVLVKDINPGSAGSYPGRPDERQRHAVLLGQRRHERRRSCGRATAPPPAPCSSRTSTPAVGSSYPGNLTNVNGTLFFTANDGTHGDELWKSDGTAAGTVLVKDINPGVSQLLPRQPDERQRHAVLHGQRRRYTGGSCGRATAPPPAPCSSRTSTPAAPARTPPT